MSLNSRFVDFLKSIGPKTRHNAYGQTAPYLDDDDKENSNDFVCEILIAEHDFYVTFNVNYDSLIGIDYVAYKNKAMSKAVANRILFSLDEDSLTTLSNHLISFSAKLTVEEVIEMAKER